MSQLEMNRKAADNKYLHKDFHVTADIGIAYVGEHFGDKGVKEYLTDFSKSFYLLLAQKVKREGLIALDEYFKKVFSAEECMDFLKTELSDEKLTVTVIKCPAVTFMRSIGHTPCKWYKEATYTVYGVLAESCGLDFTVAYYNEEDGSTEFTFTTRG